MKKHTILLLSTLLLIVGCHTDVGVFGGQYISAESKYRHFSTNSSYDTELKNNVVFLREGARVNGKYPVYLVRNGRLYLLIQYGVRGKRMFHYPSKSEREEIGLIFSGMVEPKDPCLGISWLRRDVPILVNKEKHPLEYSILHQEGEEYIEFVENKGGGFCDLNSNRK